MTPIFQTEQEKFWAGEFGNEYALRNMGTQFLANQIAYFSKILRDIQPIKSVIEFGANIGVNLQAIKMIFPEIELSAVEINKSAVETMEKLPNFKIKAYHSSLLDFTPDYQRDLAFVKGVLIHINPEKLPILYKLLHDSSKKYICIGEYYNPSPVKINYRGHEDRLFKRDFCGEFMDMYPDVKLLDYGFAYHRDNNFPQDDITWFLLTK